MDNTEEYGSPPPQQAEPILIRLYVDLGSEGVQACEGEVWSPVLLHIRADGTGWLEGEIPGSDLGFFARFVIGLCSEATVQEPPELVAEVRRTLADMLKKYS